VWSGFIWLRIGTSGGLLWTPQRTFGFHKRRGISWLHEQLLASQGRLCSIRSTRKHVPDWPIRKLFKGAVSAVQVEACGMRWHDLECCVNKDLEGEDTVYMLAFSRNSPGSKVENHETSQWGQPKFEMDTFWLRSVTLSLHHCSWYNILTFESINNTVIVSSHRIFVLWPAYYYVEKFRKLEG
jgi:hypothetical protein